MYILSTSTYKLHKDDCYHLNKVKNEHKKKFSSIDDAINESDNKIKLCKVCCINEIKEK